MGSSVIMLVIFGVCLVAFGIYYLLDKNKAAKAEASKANGEQPKQEAGYKAKKSSVPKADMSSFIRFDKIANDMIYQKNGERYSMVVECKGINYELMSEIEQMAVEEGFITFLNTLKFPIQLYVQTRSIDLSENIKLYKDRVTTFDAKKQDAVAECNRVEEDIDSTPEEIAESRREKLKYANIAEYVADITKYVERLALNKYLLQRKFYVIFSYNKSELVTTEDFSKEEYEDLCYRELYTRAQGIIGSLSACSVQGRVLNSNELAELIYISINKDDQKALNIKEALDTGFYRLYSTGEDVRQRKQELLDEEIKKASLKRIEEAIIQGIEQGTLVTEDDLNREIDKKIDKNALKLVDSSAISDQAKEGIKSILTENRKNRLKKEEEYRARQLGVKQQVALEIEEKVVEPEVEMQNAEIAIGTEVSEEDNEIISQEQDVIIADNNENTEDESIV